MTAESGQISSAEFSQAVDVAQSALADLRTADVDTADLPQPEAGSEWCGDGQAADGMVRATVTADGRVGSIRLEKKALQLGSEDLAAAVVTAVNAARQDLLATSSGEASHTAGPQSWNPEHLVELQRRSAVQMGSLIQSLGEMAGRMSRG
jgi:DNA-binding protein YbaB